MRYGVMSCLPDSSHSGFSAVGVTSPAGNSSHRNGLSIRMLCACVTSFFRKSFCVVLSLTFPEFGGFSVI